MSAVHREEADSRDQDANDQHDEGGDEAEGGRHACWHAPAGALVVENVAGGAVLPPGQGTSAAAGRVVPVHAGGDASVPAFDVPASAAAAAGIEILFGNVLRGGVADPGSVAVFCPDGATAAAFEVFFDWNVSTDGVVIPVRKPGRDHHDRDAFDSLRSRNASVRRSVAVSAATLDDGDVRNDVNDVGHVGDVGLQVDHRVPDLTRRLVREIQDIVLYGFAAGHRR